MSEYTEQAEVFLKDRRITFKAVSLDSLMKGLFKDEQHDLLDQIISDLECRIDALKDEVEEL
jgi:hypothetical protein